MVLTALLHIYVGTSLLFSFVEWLVTAGMIPLLLP